MRRLSRFSLFCIIVSLLVIFVQWRLLNLWRFNCSNCWTLFEYETETLNNSTNLQIGLINERLKKLPSALIIGVKKGGTRALIDALQLHPQIVAAKREVHFFDDETLYEKGLDWYREQMPLASNDQIVIEKTPAYFTKHICAKRVYSFNPTIKLIIIVRDPVIRTVSDFTQVQFNRLSTKNMSLLNFEENAFKLDGVTPNLSFKPISNSIYVQHFGAWLEYFPSAQFLIVDGDKFITDPMQELKKIETFLGLEHKIDSSQLVFNKRKRFYCFRPRGRQLAKCLGESKGRKTHVILSNRTHNLLHQIFRPYNEQFFQLLNRRFNWS